MLWHLFLAVLLHQQGLLCQAACVCQFKSQCIGQFDSLATAAANTCNLSNGGEGFCCDIVSPSPPSISQRTSGKTSRRRLPRPSKRVPSQQITNSLETVRTRTPVEQNPDKETLGHFQFTRPRKSNQGLHEAALKFYNLDNDLGITTFSADESGFSADNSNEVENACPWRNKRKPVCDRNAKFRTADGTCNHPNNDLFGAAGTPFNRILKATYHKKGNDPRNTSTNGQELPSARLVSQTVFRTGDSRQDEITSLFMQFAQFLDHDLTESPGPERPPRCCLKDSRDRPWIFPEDGNNGVPACFPIKVPENDGFWGPQGRRCMHLARTFTSPTISPFPCESGRWERRNELSDWLDAGMVYGSSEEELENLRDQRDRALLAVSSGNLLPTCSALRARGESAASCPAEPDECRGCTFAAGDLRANEQPMLTNMHNLWVREHNRIAKELRIVKPRWRDEKLFQEARRINIAEWQHIIFNEWLPITLGTNYMKIWNLLPLTSGYSQDFDTDHDPRINNEFATAAFRFGHTLIVPTIPEKDERRRNRTRFDLTEVFNRGDILNDRNFVENNMRGLVEDEMPDFDGSFVDDIINHLFEDEDGGLNGGFDLAALNIQRGRDHGIPGYNEYREKCASTASNFGRASSFSSLSSDTWMASADVRNLRKVYDSVEDIDLFTGGILERNHKDGLVGPTFKCIIGDQFLRLKRGDRFYYEYGADPTTRFSEAQLQELRKTSLARLHCDNSNIKRVQPLVFRMPTRGNELVSCTDGSIPRVNLDVFRESDDGAAVRRRNN